MTKSFNGKVPEEGSECIYLSLIVIDSVFKPGKNYFLEKSKYKLKKEIKLLITDDIDSSSDDKSGEDFEEISAYFIMIFCEQFDFVNAQACEIYILKKQKMYQDYEKNLRMSLFCWLLWVISLGLVCRYDADMMMFHKITDVIGFL